MNILFYVRDGVEGRKGGIARITETLVKAFRNNDHKVFLLSVIEDTDIEYDGQQMFLPVSDLKDKQNIDFVVNLLKENNITHVINQSPLTFESLEFWNTIKDHTGIKTIGCFHNSILVQAYNFSLQREYVLKKRKLGWAFKTLKNKIVKSILLKYYIHKYRPLYRKVIESNDKVILLHKGQLSELERMCGMEIDNAHIIPNCIETTNIESSNRYNEIVWVGNINFSVKRTDIILKVWKKLQDQFPDWNLKILGGGTMLKEAKDLAVKLGLKNYEFCGQVNALPFYKEAKIICVTSTHESFSLVTLEAMLNGCVPVVFDVFPAASVLIDDKINGFLVRNYDVDDMVSVLKEIMTNDAELIETSDNAIKKASNFSVDHIYDLWSKVLSAI